MPTKDGVLHLSTLSGSYSRPEAFVGTALSVAMTSNRIFLLSDMNGTKTISAFDYVTNGIGAKEDAFDPRSVSPPADSRSKGVLLPSILRCSLLTARLRPR